MRSRHFWVLALVALCSASSLLAQSIPEPIAFWRFECPDEPWLDYSSDFLDRPLNNPVHTHGAWQNRTQTGGPVGSFFNRNDANTFRMIYNTPGSWPTQMDPDAFTFEMLFRGGSRMTRASLFSLDSRVYWFLFASKMRIGVTYQGLTTAVFDIPLNGLDLLDPEYYKDGEWHHLALVYSNVNSTPIIDLYVDGATIPQFHLQLTNPLNNQNVQRLQIAFPEVFPIAIDEIAVYDEALTNVEIATHYNDFLTGRPYCFGQYANCNMQPVPPGTTYVMNRDDEEYPIGYDATNPPGNNADLAGIPNMIEQITTYPVPRYNPSISIPKNHPYPGNLEQQIDFGPGGYTFAEVPDLFAELEKNFNNSFTLGILSEATPFNLNTPNNNLGRVMKALADYALANYAAPSTPNFSVVTNWTQVAAFPLGANGPLRPHINRLDLGANQYYVNDANLNSLEYLTFFNAANQVVTRPPQFTVGPDPLSLAGPTGPGNPFSLDGMWMNTNLNNLESHTGHSVDFMLENGEEAPQILSFASGEQMMGLTPVNWTVNGGGLAGTPPTICRNDLLLNDYTFFLMGQGSTPQLWNEYQSRRKNTFRELYRDELQLNKPDLNCWWYDVSGDNVWNFDEMVDINDMSSMTSESNQNIYPTPYYYPQTGVRWFTGAGPAFGWRKLLLDRRAELVPSNAFQYFAPAVSAGISDLNNYNVSDLDMMRPGQYLGYLKAIHMVGGEYFVTFLLNASSPNSFHNIRLHGWQYAMPSYAQAPTTHVSDLYYNSEVLEGDNGAISPDQATGTLPQYRLWGGKETYLISAREGTGNFSDQYLITGSIMNYSDDNQYPNGYTVRDQFNELANVQLDQNLNLTFPIRKQGSTYHFDNTDPANPVFYQLDGWHEYKHPSRWSHDFIIEAELYDELTSPGTGSFHTVKTEGIDRNPITNGDFSCFTSFLNYSGPTPWLEFPTLSYSFQLRDIPEHASRRILVRARTTEEDTGFEMDLVGASNPVGSVAITSQNWQWYDLGTYSFGPSDRILHHIEIQPHNSSLEIDKIVIIDPANESQYPITEPEAPAATMTQTSSTTSCEGQGFCFEVTRTAGTGCWSYVYSIDGVSFTVNNLTGNNHVECLELTPGTHSIQLTSVSDENWASGTVSGNYSPTVNTAPTVSLSPTGTITVCGPSSTTLTATPGFVSYEWFRSGYSFGTTTSNTLQATQNGMYSVIVTDANGCTAEASCVNVLFCNGAGSGKQGNFTMGSKMAIFPNPNDGLFSLEADLPAKSELMIDLYSLQGIQIQSWAVQADKGHFQKDFDLSHLSKGMYLFKVQHGENTNFFRLVKE